MEKTKYSLDDLIENDGCIMMEKKIKSNMSSAKLLLYLNRCKEEGKTRVIAKDVKKFFKWDFSYAFHQIEFFADCGLLQQVPLNGRDVAWLLKPDIRHHVPTALKTLGLDKGEQG